MDFPVVSQRAIDATREWGKSSHELQKMNTGTCCDRLMVGIDKDRVPAPPNERGHRLERPYFGGCNSLLIQPITLSVFRGSNSSQSKHWNLRAPFPSGRERQNQICPALGASRSLSLSHTEILPPLRKTVNRKRISGLWVPVEERHSGHGSCPSWKITTACLK